MSVSVAVLLLLAAPPQAPAPPATRQQRVAVRALEAGYGVSPQLTRTLTDLLTAELRQRAQLSVTSQDDIVSLLSFERQRQLLNCGDTGCLSQIGNALGAEDFVNGSLSLIGHAYVLVLRRVDVRQAKVLHEASRQVAQAHESALLDAVSAMAKDLFPELQAANSR